MLEVPEPPRCDAALAALTSKAGPGTFPLLGRYDWLSADSRLAGPGHSTAGTKAVSEPLGYLALTWKKTIARTAP